VADWLRRKMPRRGMSERRAVRIAAGPKRSLAHCVVDIGCVERGNGKEMVSSDCTDSMEA
jgi:hypothetical protein